MFRWTGLLSRLVVGAVWVYAGLIKLPHPESSVAAVRAYQLLPGSVADTVGRTLPMLEVVLGLCLVFGLLTRLSAVGSALLQAAFIIGIVSVWSRGIAINCGCFGPGGADPNAFSQYPIEVTRDAGLLALSLLLALRPRTAYAVDGVLFPEPEADPEPELIEIDPTNAMEEAVHVHAES